MKALEERDMALKIPKYSSDWDKVDPIHARDAVALWFNVNPRNPKARGVATDEINNAWNEGAFRAALHT